MSYKEDLRNLLEDLRDLLSDIEYDEELDIHKGNEIIGLLSEAEHDMEDAIKLF
jgi:hypothetical protein